MEKTFCEKCTFWVETGGSHRECRRYPPTDKGFPITSSITFCGEGKPSEPEKVVNVSSKRH